MRSPGLVAGLAEALQSEFLLYGIDVHMCFPTGILSPGFVEENRVKPEVTLKIEERDVGLDPELIAGYLIEGMPARCSVVRFIAEQSDRHRER